MRKALIPAAGLGTRMFPATKAVKKELLPMITPDGVCKPILQSIVEEALSAGCDDIAIIVRPADRDLIASYFSPCSDAQLARLKDDGKAQAAHLADISRHISYVEQREQQGFGHAVHCARDWADGQPVLLLLGDHLYSSNEARSCARQLLDAFDSLEPRATLSLYQAPGSTVHHYGTAGGSWANPQHTLLDIAEFAEKPSLDYARQHLAVPGLPHDTFLCVYGQYVFTPDVFRILGEQIAANRRLKGEFQLTTALDELRQTQGLRGFMVNGEHFDTGQPREYLSSILAFANKRLPTTP